MEKEKKSRVPIWFYPSTELQARQTAERHGYKSVSEFVEAAVLNYIGQLSVADNMDYVTQTLSAIVEGTQNTSEARLRRLLYKQAVELGMIENILVNMGGYSPEAIRQLRSTVVKQINLLKGGYDFVTAAEYQNGENENSTL